MMAFQHTEPNVNGLRQHIADHSEKPLQDARRALDLLGAAAFEEVVTKALRDRPWHVSQRVVSGLSK